MRTVTDNLKDAAECLSQRLEAFLLEHSSIYYWNTGHKSVVIISLQGDYAYRELQEPGRRLQAKLLEEYRLFHSLLAVLLSGQPRDLQQTFAKAHTTINDTLEQRNTWCKTTQEALAKVRAALQSQLTLVMNLYDPADAAVVCVPDTNALLFNPYLESWTFPDVEQFAIVLTPTVLKELDRLKIEHRNEDIRKKAELIIRTLKEYRRRGRLNDGVILVKGKSSIQTTAREPNMDKSLPWLDPANNDDRFLASVVEVMRERPRSTVFAVSRDINLQNKAEFARICVEEPPAMLNA